MPKSNSLEGLYYFAALEGQLADLKRRGIEPVRLDVGSPDLPPPESVIQTLAHESANPHVHGYQSHRGTPQLRQAWADFYKKYFQVELDPEREILPLIGSKEGIYHAMHAWLSPGDAVLLPDPGYVTYRRAAQAAGAQIIPYSLNESNSYSPYLEELPHAVLKNAKILWVNYPNNPTGGTISKAALSNVISFARNHNLILCHDAAYTLVTYDSHHAPSVLQVCDGLAGVIEFNSLSKTYNMAGWRLGVAVGDPELIQKLYRLKTDIDSGHFLPMMQAAIEAMYTDPAWIKARNEIYRRRRDIVIKKLSPVGLITHIPRGSIYIWCQIPNRFRITSQEFALRMLEEAAVSITPGEIYGSQGQARFRISLTQEEKLIQDAMDRILDWIR